MFIMVVCPALYCCPHGHNRLWLQRRKGIIILASPLGRTNSGDKLTKEEQARPFAPTSLVPVTGSTLWASARHSSAQSLLSFTVRHCVLARRHDAEAILRQYPTMVGNLPSLDLELLPRYCCETNTNYEAVRLMLDLGFPIAHTESSHG